MNLTSRLSPVVQKCHRHFAAACKDHVINQQAVLSNDVKVFSVGGESPIVRLGISVQAGARYETFRTRGVTHFLRAMSAGSTEKATLIEMSRHFEQLGGFFRVMNSRDCMVFWLECLKDKVPELSPLLMQAAIWPRFYAWEVEDSKTRVQLEIDQHSTQLYDRISELTHKSAFRGGLSNSLLISPSNLERFWNKKLIDFHSENFTSNRMSIVAAGGIDEELLHKLGDSIPESKSEVAEQSGFYPRELREEYPGSAAYMCFSFPAPSWSHPSVIQYFLLEHVLGSIIRLRGSFPFLQNVLSSKCQQPITVGCQTIPYSDVGIFTLQLSCTGSEAEQAVKSTCRTLVELAEGTHDLKSLLQSAKNKAKLCLQAQMESPFALAESVAFGDVYKQYWMNPTESEEVIKSTNDQQIRNMLQEMLNNRYGFAAIGNIANVPFVDEHSKI